MYVLGHQHRCGLAIEVVSYVVWHAMPQAVLYIFATRLFWEHSTARFNKWQIDEAIVIIVSRFHVAFYFEKTVSVRFKAFAISIRLQSAHMMTQHIMIESSNSSQPLEAAYVSVCCVCFTTYTWCVRWFKQDTTAKHSVWRILFPPIPEAVITWPTHTAHDGLLVNCNT